MAKETTKRVRNWAFIVYPESAPDDWLERLRDLCVPGLVSPLHDKDANPDGEPKKAHYHVVLMFSGKKSFDQVKAVSDDLNASNPVPVNDLRGYARYLIHIDNPEKYQYQANDVLGLCGQDYYQYIETSADLDNALDEILDWCIDNQCYSFRKLVDYSRKNRRDWFRILASKRSTFVMNYIKSYEWEIKNGLL